jgi:hypothetical protein
VHVLDPGARELKLPAIAPHIRAAELITGGTVECAQREDRTVLRINALENSSAPWTVKLTLDGDAPGMLPAE